MKYQKVLEEKKLTLEKLPKATQNKISKIQELAKKLETASPEEVEKIKEEIIILDFNLEKSLKKFDYDKYIKKLEVIEEMNKKRLEEKGKKSIKKIEYEKYDDGDEDEDEEDEIVEQDEQEQVEQPNIVRMNLKRVSRNWDSIKKSAEATQQISELNKEEDDTWEDEEEEEEYHKVEEVDEEEDIKDFKKTKEVKPKKMSTSFILMGVGAFLFTWGAVNFWKERRH